MREMKLIIESWRRFLNESTETSNVVAHLAGQAGSGKNYFIDNFLLKAYPDLVVKDLDDFDDEADAVVASGPADKTWREDFDNVDQELARKHFEHTQALLDNFISENKDSQVFLVGMSTFPWVKDGNNSLDLGSPRFKFYLDVPHEVAAKRRLDRDIEKGLYGKAALLPEEEYLRNIQADIEYAKVEKDNLLSIGYVPKSQEEIIEIIGNET